MIVRGAVKIFLAEPDGSEVILSVIGPRRTFGDMSLVDGMVRSANVAAMQRSLLYWMNRNDFSECVKAIPAFHDAILHSMSMRVRLANEHICALASLESKHRIARALRMFADDYGVPNGAGTLIPFPITQSEIASLVGISRVRVNQIVSAWKQQGVIAIDGRHRITLMKSDALPSPRDPIDSTSDSDAR
jgi:CRP/FNR family transcriptional regulator